MGVVVLQPSCVMGISDALHASHVNSNRKVISKVIPYRLSFRRAMMVVGTACVPNTAVEKTIPGRKDYRFSSLGLMLAGHGVFLANIMQYQCSGLGSSNK